MNNNNAIIAVLVLVVVVLVGWFMYRQGYFTGAQNNEKDPVIEVNIPGSSASPKGY